MFKRLFGPNKKKEEERRSSIPVGKYAELRLSQRRHTEPVLQDNILTVGNSKAKNSASSSKKTSATTSPLAHHGGRRSPGAHYQQWKPLLVEPGEHRKPPPAPRKGSTKRKSSQDKSVLVFNAHDHPLVYPCPPELILSHHKRTPFLNQSEEWLLVELNQYQCLVETLDMIKIIAKHSMIFELDPAELWEEFFHFVEGVSSYDDVINFDIWQEFREKRYPF